jgi:hypothetical protein
MHLEGPWLSTTGKKRGKKKFASAEHARKARELNDSWQQLLKKHEVKSSPSKPKVKSLSESYKLSIPEGRNTTAHIKSLDTGLGIATKQESPKYTGTLIKGIATMHKSNAVPVINEEQAIEISKMRR